MSTFTKVFLTTLLLATYTCCIMAADRIGDECLTSDTPPCTVPNSECVRPTSAQVRRCRCVANYVDNGNNQCLKAAKWEGQSCLEGQQLQCSLMENSVCVNNQCVCPEGFIFINDPENPRCLPEISELGKYCEDYRQCKFPNSTCIGTDTQPGLATCQCISEFHVQLAEEKCLPKATWLDEECEEDIQCETEYLQGMAHCKNGTCQCKPGFIHHHLYPYLQLCSKPILLGESCQDNLEESCVDASGSTDVVLCARVVPGEDRRRCQCSGLYKEYNGRCYRTLYLGQACSSHEACKASIKGPTICDPATNKCTCEKGFSGADFRQECLPADVPFGGECNADHYPRQCKNTPGIVGGQECFAGKCQCANLFRLNAHGYCVDN